MKFDFASPTRIVFGAGTLGRAADIIRSTGTRVLVVTGSRPERAEPLLAQLKRVGVAATTFAVTGEPTLACITQGVEAGQSAGCDLVIGFGGGSALDAAKAIAAMSTNPGDLLDYLEVIGKGQPLLQTPLPFIAIPTTAGTGSEVTRNAVLGSPDHQVKVSLRSPLMLARVAIVDPELMLKLPPEVTASTGMDALTQCIEAYVSCKASPFTDAFCIEGVRRAARSLRKAVAQGGDLDARTDMALASLFSGIALSNAGLGAVHGFAGPLGGMFSAPHGALCAALLPSVTKTNLAALHEREPRNPALRRFEDIAGLLTNDKRATADAAVERLEQLHAELRIPRLGHWGISEKDFPTIIPKAAAASSMKGNPLKLDDNELHTILATAV